MRPLIVLGASARAAAFSALRAGFTPFAIDAFADRDLVAACGTIKISQYPQEFLGALAEAPNAPWIYTGGLENHPRLVDRLREIRPLLGNAGSVLRRVRSPGRLAEVVSAVGLLIPDIAGSLKNARRQDKWLIKPRRSGGGLGIRFAIAAEGDRPPHGAYFQKYVDGEAASAVFVAAGGAAELLGATRQLLGRDFSLECEFLYAGSIGPLALNSGEQARLKALGIRLAEEFGLVGLFNVDFVRTPETLWPVEVNPRYSASVEVLERCFGIAAIGMHVAASETQLVPQATAWNTDRVWGKAIAYAPHDSRVSARFDALVDALNEPGAVPLIADLPRVGDSLLAGQPIATVFADGDTASEVEQSLRSRVAQLLSTLSPAF